MCDMMMSILIAHTQLKQAHPLTEGVINLVSSTAAPFVLSRLSLRRV